MVDKQKVFNRSSERIKFESYSPTKENTLSQETANCWESWVVQAQDLLQGMKDWNIVFSRFKIDKALVLKIGISHDVLRVQVQMRHHVSNDRWYYSWSQSTMGGPFFPPYVYFGTVSLIHSAFQRNATTNARSWCFSRSVMWSILVLSFFLFFFLNFGIIIATCLVGYLSHDIQGAPV